MNSLFLHNKFTLFYTLNLIKMLDFNSTRNRTNLKKNRKVIVKNVISKPDITSKSLFVN